VAQTIEFRTQVLVEGKKIEHILFAWAPEKDGSESRDLKALSLHWGPSWRSLKKKEKIYDRGTKQLRSRGGQKMIAPPDRE